MELFRWRQFIAVLTLVTFGMAFGNSAYSFGYLGFSGFATQGDLQQLMVNQLEEQIARVTVRRCEASKTGNMEAFDLAGKQLSIYRTQYRKLTKRDFLPSCQELLIGF